MRRYPFSTRILWASPKRGKRHPLGWLARGTNVRDVTSKEGCRMRAKNMRSSARLRMLAPGGLGLLLLDRPQLLADVVVDADQLVVLGQAAAFSFGGPLGGSFRRAAGGLPAGPALPGRVPPGENSPPPDRLRP